MLINEYEITEKTYIRWVYESKKEGMKFFFTVFWSLMFLGCMILFILNNQNYLFLIFALYCIYRALFRDYAAAKALYKKAISAFDDNKWRRIITISEEGIVINDGKIAVNYKTSDIIKIVENENQIRLFMNDNTSIRLYKNSFVKGNWEDYKNILNPTPKSMRNNDNYNRKELIKTVSYIFGEELTESELSERAALWKLADNTKNSEILSELSISPYLEVREAVAYNPNTPVDILISLLDDESCEVRETAVLNYNTPISAVEKLSDDEHQLVRDAVIRRKKT